MSPAIPTLSSAFSLLGKQAAPTTSFGGMQTSTPSTMAPSSAINWNAITIKPPVQQYSTALPKATPAIPSLNMGMQTSTPATSTPMMDFSKYTPPASTSNVQSNDTALRPGQFGAGTFATINSDGSSTPSAYAKMPAMPNMSAPSSSPTPAPSSYVKTPSGATVDAATGGVVSAAEAQTPASFGSNTGNSSSSYGYSGSAGGAPALPSTGQGSYNPLITSPEAEDLFKKYQDSLKPSDEENSAQERLNSLNTAAAMAYTNTQNQPIALPFITGQQAAQQRSQALLAQPLESQIALLQAKRQIASTSSKAALDRSDAQAAARRDLATKTVSTPFGGSVAQYDPTTGTYKNINTGGGSGDQAAQDSWVNLIKSGQAALSDVPMQLRQGVAQSLGQSSTVSKANQDAIAQADTVLGAISEVLPNVTDMNTGIAGAALSKIPGSSAYNLARQIDTIKANVGFSALQAMRNASPTGGALGQVSEQENRLLQSTLASLDQGQGSAQLKANLAKVQTHFENLKQILSAPLNSQVSYDNSGKVIISAPSGAFSNNSSSQSGQSGSGSIYDW